MMSLRFHKGLYSTEALDAALSAFAPFASCERAEESEHLVVQLSCRDSADDEPAMAGEFANYVLGATVDGAKAQRSAT